MSWVSTTCPCHVVSVLKPFSVTPDSPTLVSVTSSAVKVGYAFQLAAVFASSVPLLSNP